MQPFFLKGLWWLLALQDGCSELHLLPKLCKLYGRPAFAEQDRWLHSGTSFTDFRTGGISQTSTVKGELKFVVFYECQKATQGATVTASSLGAGELGVLTFTNNVTVLDLRNTHTTLNLNCREYVLSSFLSLKDNCGCA